MCFVFIFKRTPRAFHYTYNSFFIIMIKHIMTHNNMSNHTKKKLITSALPYVNNIPHLGNLIQVLSADVCARFFRSRGYETLYICGTDEYGTTTETKAKEEKISPEELCNKYYKEHKKIYDWFCISFNKFGRTSNSPHTQIVQKLFLQVFEAGYINEHIEKQLYSEKSEMFLPDRYIRGICPKCEYKNARGDQCEKCGTLLDPLDLINPICITDNTTPIVKETKHLYINLPKILPKLQKWMENKGMPHKWTKNAIKTTQAWIRDGLKERAITRDLKWGIPVPIHNFKNKVFYVWFDAPIGYVSITASHTQKWKDWWYAPNEVDLIQFIGKDNILFHTILFPSAQLASEENNSHTWTKLTQISSTEYLNYENSMFSKSRGIGIFGNDAIDTGIPCDMWRFYMMYNRPESSDYTFTWKNFQSHVNGELINNLSNLCNRTFTFISKNMDSTVLPLNQEDAYTKDIWKEITKQEKTITELMEKIELREAYKKIFILSNYGNKIFQENEPWNLIKKDSQKTHVLLSNLIYLIRDLSTLIYPFTPHTSFAIRSILQLEKHPYNALTTTSPPLWKNLSQNFTEIKTITRPTLLFKRLEDAMITEFQSRFSGSQKGRSIKNKNDTQKDTSHIKNAEHFSKTVQLLAAKIIQIEEHSDAERLYILTLDDGSKNKRNIVSGLRKHYTIDELAHKNIILVANLKKAKFRNVESNGMLLATSSNSTDTAEIIEVLFLSDDTTPGTPILPDGHAAMEGYSTIKPNVFFSYSLVTKNFTSYIDNIPLTIHNEKITSKKIKNGTIG